MMVVVEIPIILKTSAMSKLNNIKKKGKRCTVLMILNCCLQNSNSKIIELTDCFDNLFNYYINNIILYPLS